MIKGVGDLFYLGGVGEDIFGESYTGRIARKDPTNKYLLLKQLQEYVRWHEQNGRFYDEYSYDKKKLRVLGLMKWAWAAGGVCFAGIIVNPNFTSKYGAFYLRKISVVFWGTVFYAYGRKK